MSRRRTARLAVPFVAALSAGALAAAPASATISTVNPIETGENVTVFHNIDFVAVFYPLARQGDSVTVEVERDGVVLGTATGPLVEAEGMAALEVNHGPEAPPPADGDCWTAVTPDIRPGDIVRVRHGTDIDEVTVDRIEFVGDPRLLPNGDVIQNGVALRMDGTPNGTPIPTEALDSNGFLDTSKFRGPAHEVRAWAERPGGFTNVFHPPYDMERNQIYPTVEERRNSLLFNGGHEAGFGHVDPLPLESMLLDGNADEPTVALNCTGTAEGNRVTGAPSHINAATGDITLTGTKMTAADGGVSVQLTDSAGNPTVAKPAQVTGNDWSVVLTPQERAGLVDGTIVASASYMHGTTPIGGKTLEIEQDTVLPTLSASPDSGTYTGETSVTLSAGPGEEIRYRTDGGDVSPSDSLYSGPIPLGFGTTNLSVRVADAAGNVITRSFSYTVNRPTAAPAGSAAPVVVQSLATPQPSGRRTRLVATARQTMRMRLSTVRRRGLRVAFSAPAGTRTALVRLYRVRGSSRRLLSTRRLSVRAGRRSVRFSGKRLRAGSYLVQLRVGTSRSSLGSARNIRVQIMR